MSHTQGKLTHRSFSIYAADDKTPVADTCLTNSVPDNDEANARRLVAAWNACDGLSTEQLERAGTLDRASVSRNVAISNTIKNLTAERDSLRAVNAELLGALEDAAVLADFAECWITDPAIEGMSSLKGGGDKFRAAIASARKQGEQG